MDTKSFLVKYLKLGRWSVHYTIYVDLVWLVQCYINGILLIWIKFFLRKESTILKILFAILIGGIGNTFVIVICSEGIQRKFMLIAPVFITIFLFFVNLGMFRIAFGKQNRKGYIKLMGMYWIVAIAFAGFLSFSPQLGSGFHTNRGFLSVSGRELLIKGIVFIIMLPIVNQLYQRIKLNRTQCYLLEFEHRGKKIRGMGLLDTGNCLRNCQNNEPVVIAEYQFMKELFSVEEQNYLEKMLNWNCDIQNENIKVVYIPYHSLGESQGLLLGVYIEQLGIYLGNERKQIMHNLVGLYPGKISVKEEYQVILHTDCVEAKDNMR